MAGMQAAQLTGGPAWTQPAMQLGPGTSQTSAVGHGSLAAAAGGALREQQQQQEEKEGRSRRPNRRRQLRAVLATAMTNRAGAAALKTLPELLAVRKCCHSDARGPYPALLPRMSVHPSKPRALHLCTFANMHAGAGGWCCGRLQPCGCHCAASNRRNAELGRKHIRSLRGRGQPMAVLGTRGAGLCPAAAVHWL